MKYYISDLGYELILVHDSVISYEKHNHSSKNVIGIVLSGTVRVEFENETMEYKTGEYFIIPRYAVHSVMISDERTYLLNVCVGDEFLKEHKRIPSFLLENMNEMFDLYVFDKKYIFIMETAYRMLQENYTSRKEMCFGTLEEARKKVINEPEKSLDINLLSKMSQMSKYHFIRTFHNKVGLTPHSYQIQNRIRKAQKLLQQGIPLMDVALEMGFYDQSHFNKYFHKIVGITPKEYINSITQIE